MNLCRTLQNAFWLYNIGVYHIYFEYILRNPVSQNLLNSESDAAHSVRI